MPGHHDDSEYLEAIEEGNQTSTEIADYVDVARQTAYERLHRMEERGQVEGEKIGNTIRWSLSD